jgi:DNA repair exonuclease SbcCD ATPase subunit
MIIKRMKASFGKLNNEEQRFDEGFNILFRPNESGKSTWCAFIRIMLYGLSTSERDKAGFLADKTKYRPWGQYPMEGLMDIIWKGREITLIRKSKGTNLMGICEAFYTGTSEPCPELSGRSPGDRLIGVPEQVFVRSAFIRRPAMILDKDAELEKRISALVASGDEDTSYIEAADRLNKRLRKITRKPSGQLALAEYRRQELTELLNRLEAQSLWMFKLREEKERLSGAQSEIKAELALHRNKENEALTVRYRELRAEEATLADEIDGLTKSLSASGRLISQEDIRLVQTALNELAQSHTLTTKAGDAADERYEMLQRKKISVAGSSRRKSKTAAYLAFLGVFLVAFNMLSSIAYLWMFGAALILIAVIVLIIDLKRTEKTAAEHKEELENLESEYNSAQEQYRAHERVNKELGRRAKAYLSRLDPKAELENAQSVIRDCETGLIRLEQLMLRHRAAQRNADELSKICSEHTAEQETGALRFSKEEAGARLTRIEEELEQVSGELAMAAGEGRYLGDPLVLGTEAERLEEEIRRLTQESDALTLALETLSEANTELQNRFSPLVSALSGRHMREMTDGRYTGVLFDKRMNFRAQTDSELVHRELGYLSDGTADQLYLAARLAVSQLVLPEADPCPLIIDDALANFDDDRARRAIQLLRKLSEKRQILFFTCRGREAVL